MELPIVNDLRTRHEAVQEREDGCILDALYLEIAADLIEELAAALEPFAAFADAWDKQPLRGIDDRLHSIHGTTHFRLSDAKRARAALARAKSDTTAEK